MRRGHYKGRGDGRIKKEGGEAQEEGHKYYKGGGIHFYDQTEHYPFTNEQAFF